MADNPFAKYATANPFTVAPADKYKEAGLQNEAARLALARETNARAAAAQAQAAQIAANQRRQNPISPADATFIRGLMEQGQGATGMARTIENAAGAIDRLGTGPMRAKMLSAAIPEEGGGVMDTLGGAMFGGLVNKQTVDDWQTLRALQNSAVLDKQIEQKGPQTDSDALRMKLASISPDKTVKANAEVIGQTMLGSQLMKHKPDFYTKWANKYGSLTAVSPGGQTVNSAWDALQNDAMNRYNNDPRIKAMRAGQPAQQKRQDTGWKVERIED